MSDSGADARLAIATTTREHLCSTIFSTPCRQTFRSWISDVVRLTLVSSGCCDSRFHTLLTYCVSIRSGLDDLPWTCSSSAMRHQCGKLRRHEHAASTNSFWSCVLTPRLEASVRSGSDSLTS